MQAADMNDNFAVNTEQSIPSIYMYSAIQGT